MIPKIIHFVFGLAPGGGGKPFSFFHYLAIKSALKVNPDYKIYFVCAYLPVSPYFDLVKDDIEIVMVTPPQHIFNNKLCHFAHQADVIRLERLIEFGGIYLDMDTLCLKSFDPFLSTNKLIMAPAYDYWSYKPKSFLRKILKALKLHHPAPIRVYRGLCNAVMIAPPQDAFLIKWYNEYKTFRSKGHDEFWDEHSVILPAKLAEETPELLNIVDDKCFFYPSFDDDSLKDLFEHSKEYKEAYVFHLWESLSYERYLKVLNKEFLLHSETSYSKVARKYID